ncbi:hypothetical protein ACLBVR_36685, partial [Pseudomonas aeruginosa]
VRIRPSWSSVLTRACCSSLGQQAAAGGYKGALSKGLSKYDSVAGGVTFRVYLDKFTGAVTSFHPK